MRAPNDIIRNFFSPNENSMTHATPLIMWNLCRFAGEILLEDRKKNDWGWIQTTSALLRHSPQSFRIEQNRPNLETKQIFSMRKMLANGSKRCAFSGWKYQPSVRTRLVPSFGYLFGVYRCTFRWILFPTKKIVSEWHSVILISVWPNNRHGILSLMECVLWN